MKEESRERVAESAAGVERIRARQKELFAKVLRAGGPLERSYDPEELIHFAPLRAAPREEEERLRAEIERLAPFFQGPFPVTPNLTITGAYDARVKCKTILGPLLPESLEGRSVLEIACNAGYDSFFLNLRRPRKYLAVDPNPVVHPQALFLNAHYGAGIDFQCLDWRELAPERHGVFDWVICIGLLYHEVSPMDLLAKMYEMTAVGGSVLLETLVLASDARAPVAKFIGGSFRGDPNTWWLPTTTCAEAMLAAAGFSEPRTRSKLPDFSLNPADPERTVEGWPREAIAYFTARKLEKGGGAEIVPAAYAADAAWEADATRGRPGGDTSDADYYRQQLEQTRAALEGVYATLNSSLSWRFAFRMGQWASRLCPPGSLRGRLFASARSWLRSRLRR